MPSATSVRVILDTNVLVAGLLWRGPPHVLLELARRGTLHLISSSALLTELVKVIQRPKFDASRSRISSIRTGSASICARRSALALSHLER